MDAARMKADLEAKGIDVLRLVFPDMLGITRSKDLLVSQLERAKSPAFCQGVLVTTTRGGVLDGNDIMSDGLPDLTTRIDGATMRPMPWEPASRTSSPTRSTRTRPRARSRRAPSCGSVMAQYAEARPRAGRRPRARVLHRRGGSGWRVAARHPPHRPRLHDRLDGRPGRHPAAPAAHARRHGHRRLRRQPRVQPVAVRDQPVAQRRAGCRRPHVPAQDRDQGHRRPHRQARDVPRQAVVGRGRQRIPPALLRRRAKPARTSCTTAAMGSPRPRCS